MQPDRGNSFEALALPHLDVVYRVARRLSRNPADAEEWVQETYLRAQKAFARFDLREYGIRPWLLRILHNVFLNSRSREKLAPRAVDFQSLDRREDSPVARAELRPPELDYERLDEEVKQAIDALPTDFRTVLLLWATKEMSYQEIADVLAVPVGTIMSRLHRARQRLCDELQTYAREQRLMEPATK
jgi:RNA polymerase sigma-70 factor, ECF subfamily